MLLNNYRYLLSCLILAMGYYEAGTGLFQWTGILLSNNLSNPYTGSFYNIGPYACFLSIMVPIAVDLMSYKNYRVIRWAAIGLVLISVLLISASLSRTAIAASVIGSLLTLYNRDILYLKKKNA